MSATAKYPSQPKVADPAQIRPVPMVAAPEAPADGAPVIDGSLVAQLNALYADRQRLFQTLGTADADEIVAMVRSLEAQLVDLYGERHQRFAQGTADERSKLTLHTETRDDR